MPVIRQLSSGEKYAGKIVAVKNFKSRRVIASASNYKLARQKARAKGYPDAVFFFVPEKETVNLA